MSGEGVLSVFQACLLFMFSFAAGSSRHQYGKFTLLPGQTLGHAYKSVDAASPAMCGISCSDEDRCVAVTFTSDTGQCNLNDKNPFDYPVTIKTGETNAPVVGFGRTGESCPPGWDAFNRHCYLFPIEQRSWLDANGECLSRQAMLVSVNDAAEYSFVVQGMQKYGRTAVWLGMDDVHGARTWADGQTMSYSKFHPDEPNNTSGNQNCLMLYVVNGVNYGMDDNWCDDVITFVCEMELY